jgi:hypothetical protein
MMIFQVFIQLSHLHWSLITRLLPFFIVVIIVIIVRMLLTILAGRRRIIVIIIINLLPLIIQFRGFLTIFLF